MYFPHFGHGLSDGFCHETKSHSGYPSQPKKTLPFFVFFIITSFPQTGQALQRNNKVSEKAMDAALNYLVDLGFITQIDSGRWRYANPDVFAQRRDVIASMGRKAKANRNRGWAKLTGRTDF